MINNIGAKFQPLYHPCSVTLDDNCLDLDLMNIYVSTSNFYPNIKELRYLVSNKYANKIHFITTY